ncbi:tyrosine-type recombinase/integrase [Nitrospira sp. Nam74]
MELRESIQAFLQFLEVERRASAGTIRAYHADLDQFEAFLRTRATALDARKVDAYAIRGYMASLVHRKQKPRTIARKFAAIRSLYEFLLRERVVRVNPGKELRSPKVHVSISKVLTKDEAEALMEMPQGEGTQALRDRAILETLYSTGARVSELVAMNWSDVDWQEGTVVLHGPRNKARRTPIGQRALDSLAAHRQGMSESPRKDSGPVFLNRHGGRLTAQTVSRVVSRYSRGLAGGGISGRGLRRSFASHLLDEGANAGGIQYMLGTASLSSLQEPAVGGIENLLQLYARTHPRAKGDTDETVT